MVILSLIYIAGDLSPLKTYDLILADPPWKYSFSKSKSRRIENHYPPMKLKDIQSLPVSNIAKPDCFLLIWSPFPKLEGAISVINAWGFQYITGDVWDKISQGMGYYWRNQHELLLLAKRGKPEIPLPKRRPRSGMKEKRTKHSKKPECSFERIEFMWPHLSKVELFSRKARPGWDVIGDEIDGRDIKDVLENS